MRQVNTRGGVFGSGGYGGGLFDGSNNGFGGVSGLGATYEQAAAGLGAQGLGAAPSTVCIYMPYQCQNWSSYDAETQAQILAQANLVNSQFQAQVGLYRKEKACDGTSPGRMAGALKEYLASKGGDPAKMSPDEDVFGSKECAEWWRVFGKAPTADDAKTLFGTQTVGPLKVTLENVCSGLTITPPSCPKPAPPAPPPAPPPVTPLPPPVVKKKSMSSAWIVGGLLAGAIAVGVAVAATKKKH